MPPVKMASPRVMISDNIRIINVQRSLGEGQTLKVPTRKLSICYYAIGTCLDVTYTMQCDSLPAGNIQDLCVIELTYFHYTMGDVWERFVNVHIWNMINNTYTLHIKSTT